jgi:hypothetical protein
LLLLSLVAAGVSSSEEASTHEVFDVDSSSGESEASWKSTVMLLLLGGGIFVTSEVIHPSSFGVFQQLVGVHYLLEFFLGFGVCFIAVGVVLLGALLESSLDLFFIGILLDSKDLVRVGDLGISLREECEEEQYDGKDAHLLRVIWI